jgi:hypothetical protein
MNLPADGLRHQPAPISGEMEPVDCGYFSLDFNIARALGQKGHLGYSPENGTWEAGWHDCGYYAMNGSIIRALKRLACS